VETDRRHGTSKLILDLTSGVLVVGGRTAVLEAEPPPDVVVTTYVDLVVSQRAVAPNGVADLRDRELEQLATVLELPGADLDALIERELDRLLGRDAPVAVRAEHRRRWLAAAGGIALAAAAAVAATAASASGPSDGTGTTGGGSGPVPTAPPAAEAEVDTPVESPAAAVEVESSTVASVPAPIADPVPDPIGQPLEPVGTPEVVTLPDGTEATRTESPPAPPTADTDVDTAVVYER
jgi:hypothetical protein